MLVLSHQTALWLLTSPLVNYQIRNDIADQLQLNDYTPLEKEADLTHAKTGGQPPSLKAITPRRAIAFWSVHNRTGVALAQLGTLHFLVPKGSSRRPADGARAHQWSGPLPPNSLIRLTNDLWVCSPEFCFLQMAGQLSDASLALLGMALCGTYFPADCEKGFVDCRAVTTPERIQSFLENTARTRGPRGCQGLRGFARAMRVARRLLKGARSPLEASTVTLMHFPRSRGGYGIGGMALNANLPLSAEASRIFGRPSIRPDIRFPAARLSIECLGKPYHKHPERDIRRELALKHDGDNVVLLTHEQLVKAPQRTEVMHTVARAVHKRVRPLPSRFSPRRTQLLRELFPRPSTRDASGNWKYEQPPWALPGDLLRSGQACTRR